MVISGILRSGRCQQKVAGGRMVYLGGPRGRRGRRSALYLHDPPPGYRPPRRHLSEKDQRRILRTDWILLRVATVVVVPVVIALIVIIVMMVAAHS